jgi:polyhydroxybutyrate depolymerase
MNGMTHDRALSIAAWTWWDALAHFAGVAVVSLSLCLAPATALAVFTPGNNTRTLTHDSELRAYNVYAPPSYPDTSPVPLVVDLHGFSSNKEQQQGISGWQAKADDLGLLVAYPDGLDNSWNAGVCCGGAVTNDEDDVGFIRAMVAAIQAEASVDASRIYATGLSNGGAMTHRLACEAADVFAAAAPLAFPTPYTDFANQCQPSRSIPVLMFMGLTDVLIPYSGGTFGSALGSFDSWRTKNVCGAQPPPEQHVDFGGSYCDVDLTCAANTQVGLCSIRGTAFDPPLDIFSGHVLYFNDDALALADTIWQFFTEGSLAPAPVPSLAPAAMLALAGGLAAVGAVLRKRRR